MKLWWRRALRGATNCMDRVTMPIPVPLIIDKEGRFLLIYKLYSISSDCDNRWQFPGGRMDFGDDFHTAIKKKIRQYLGVDAEPGEIVDKVISVKADGKDGQQYHFVVMPVMCDLHSEDFKLQEDKIGDAQWFTFEEARDLNDQGLLVQGDLEIMEHCWIEKVK